jgi:HSP20 family molecular chaperone IbpA
MADDTAIEKRETSSAEVERTHAGRTYIPQVDIVENKGELLLIADVPGAKADGIDVDYERGRLTIQATVEQRQPEDRTQYLLHEYGVGDFCRSFDVGEGIDAEKIHAEITDGVLTLHLPKAQELLPRKITVKTGK